MANKIGALVISDIMGKNDSAHCKTVCGKLCATFGFLASPSAWSPNIP